MEERVGMCLFQDKNCSLSSWRGVRGLGTECCCRFLKGGGRASLSRVLFEVCLRAALELTRLPFLKGTGSVRQYSADPVGQGGYTPSKAEEKTSLNSVQPILG